MTEPAALDAARAAYRRAVAALDDLAAALVAAGILSPVDLDAEEATRAAARERQRARRARLAAERETGAAPVTLETVTGETPPPARARVPYKEELRTTPGLSTTNPPPLAVAPVAPPQVAPSPAVTLAPAPAPAHPQERPALHLYAPNAPATVSAPPPAPGDAPRRGPGRPRKTPAPVTLPGVTTDAAPVALDDAAAVWDAYQRAAGSRAVLTPARRQLIRRRLAEGFTVAQLARACEGYARSPWHQGRNPAGRPYKAAELWFRDAAHVEQGLTLADAPLTPAAPAGAPNRPPLDGIAAAWEAEEAPPPVDDADVDVIGAALDG